MSKLMHSDWTSQNSEGSVGHQAPEHLLNQLRGAWFEVEFTFNIEYICFQSGGRQIILH